MRTRTVLAVLALLAAVLVVGLTTDAGADAGRPPADKIAAIGAILAQTAENQVDGMSCTATPVPGADRHLMVFTVVCQAKVETG